MKIANNIEDAQRPDSWRRSGAIRKRWAMIRAGLALAMACSLAGCNADPEEAHQVENLAGDYDSSVTVQAANSWGPGDSIPAELRRYRTSPSDMPTPMDTESFISKVTNLSLLAALATDVGADVECREEAFKHGMYVGGPTRFFAAVELSLDAIGEAREPWLAELRDRMARRHVVVDALFIDDAGMSSKEASEVLEKIERSLRAGSAWDVVYQRYADDFGYGTGDRTKIGNLGRLVVFNDASLGSGHFVDAGPHTVTWQGEALPRRLWRLSYFDASHLPEIIRSPVGAVIRLHSSDYHQHVLYQVQEVFVGGR